MPSRLRVRRAAYPCDSSSSCLALRSLWQPILERERQEERHTKLGLDVVRQAGLIGPRVLVRGVVLVDLKVLEFVVENVVADFEHGREPAIEEDAQTDAGV